VSLRDVGKGKKLARVRGGANGRWENECRIGWYNWLSLYYNISYITSQGRTRARMGRSAHGVVRQAHPERKRACQYSGRIARHRLFRQSLITRIERSERHDKIRFCLRGSTLPHAGA